MASNRMKYFMASEMGREYFNSGDYVNARRVFSDVCSIYRKEAWVVLLGANLGYLRQIAIYLGLLKEYIEYSLELSALPIPNNIQMVSSSDEAFNPVTLLSMSQQIQAQKEVMEIVQGLQSLSSIDGGSIAVEESNPITLEIDLVSPLRGVLSVCVAFCEPTVKLGKPAGMAISLLTRLPTTLLLSELHIEFNQPQCNLLLKNSDQYNLQLQPCEWNRLFVNVVAGASGKLECLSVKGRIGEYATVECQVESPVSREPFLEPRLESLPIKDVNLAAVGQKVIQVEEPEALVDIEFGFTGPALVGEIFPVTICVRSKGHRIHSGELQLTTSVLTSTELFSPTTPTPPSTKAVEMLAENSNGTESCFKVPEVEINGSWSTQISLRWFEAEKVSLIASFGYYPEANDLPQQLWVYRKSQIDCEEGLRLSYRYMSIFRRDPLFLPSSSLKPYVNVLPAIEPSMMVIDIKNPSSFAIRLQAPLHLEERENAVCQVIPIKKEEQKKEVVLFPGEAFKQYFRVYANQPSPSMEIATLMVYWCKAAADDVINQMACTELAVGGVAVESVAVVVSLQCPSYGLLGIPFTLGLCVENKSGGLEEVKFSVIDAQGFLVCGDSRGSAAILPHSTHVISFKLVPVSCGAQQLPTVELNTLAGSSYQPLSSALHFFVFPSKPPRLT